MARCASTVASTIAIGHSRHREEHAPRAPPIAAIRRESKSRRSSGERAINLGRLRPAAPGKRGEHCRGADDHRGKRTKHDLDEDERQECDRNLGGGGHVDALPLDEQREHCEENQRPCLHSRVLEGFLEDEPTRPRGRQQPGRLHRHPTASSAAATLRERLPLVSAGATCLEWRLPSVQQRSCPCASASSPRWAAW